VWEAAEALKAMRATGHGDLYDQVVLFLQALAVEAGAAADAGEPLPGVPMGGDRYSLDVPHAPVLIGYTRHPEQREFRVTDLIWLGD
jgi:hypothetical protein